MKNAWKNLPVMGAALGVVIVSALGLAYWSNVKDREHYLQSRNFRLLAVLARQTEQLFENRSRVYLKEVSPRLSGITAKGQWIPWPAASRASEDAHTNERRRGSKGALHELEGGEVWLADTKNEIEKPMRRLADYSSRVKSDGQDLQFDWLASAGDDSKNAFVSIKVPAAETLDSIFRPKLNQGAFDTLLLADVKGAIVYAAGRRTTEMHATSVTALLPKGAEATRAKSSIADSVSEERVLIAGVQYPLVQTAVLSLRGRRRVRGGRARGVAGHGRGVASDLSGAGAGRCRARHRSARMLVVPQGRVDRSAAARDTARCTCNLVHPASSAWRSPRCSFSRRPLTRA